MLLVSTPLHRNALWIKEWRMVSWVQGCEILWHRSIHCEAQLVLHLQDVWKLCLIDRLHLPPTPVIWAQFSCQIKTRKISNIMDELPILRQHFMKQRRNLIMSLELTLIVPSREQESRNCSQQRRSITTSECPSRVCMHWPLAISHICNP
jgi:hypothetical protein